MTCRHPLTKRLTFRVQPEVVYRDGSQHHLIWCGKCGSIAEVTTKLGQPEPRLVWQKPAGND